MIINKKKNYRETKQRQRILELLESTESHPNANWLYEHMKHDFPNLSISTVYRNLRILKKQGRIASLPFGPTFDRFDGKRVPHQHVVCQTCGKVMDIELDGLQKMRKSAEESSN
jgi:Fe2+ or Zn2+ uptake regulation protein